MFPSRRRRLALGAAVGAAALLFQPVPALAVEKGQCDTVFVMDAFCEAGKSALEATGDAITAPVRFAADSAVDTITTWVADTAHWLLGKVLNFIDDSTSPDLEAEWFTERYEFMIGLASLVVLPMLLVASIRAILTQDVGQLLRSFFLYLPVAVMGTTVAIFLTKSLLSITDALSSFVARGVGAESGQIFDSVGEALGSTGVVSPALPSFAIFIGALLLVIGSFFVWLELLVRSAAVTVSAFFLPLMLAGLVWPATSRWTRRLVETLIALILSKFVIVAVISLATAALADPGGGGFGAVMGAAALMLMAAFSPLALLKLMPVVEGAAIAQFEGVGRKPINTVRPGGSVHQAASMMRSKVGGGQGPQMALAGAAGPAVAAGAVASRRSRSDDGTVPRPPEVPKSSSRASSASPSAANEPRPSTARPSSADARTSKRQDRDG